MARADARHEAPRAEDAPSLIMTPSIFPVALFTLTTESGTRAVDALSMKGIARENQWCRFKLKSQVNGSACWLKLSATHTDAASASSGVSRWKDRGPSDEIAEKRRGADASNTQRASRALCRKWSIAAGENRQRLGTPHTLVDYSQMRRSAA